jgi:hypothetical protein
MATSRADYIAPIAAIIGLIAVCLPLLKIPYSSDDLVNRNWALKGWGAGFAEMRGLIEQWMNEQGRFFPTAGAYVLAVWETFTSRASYTGFLTCLAIVLGLIVFVCIREYTGRWATAVVVTTVFACGVQCRFWYDGFASFAGLVPFSLLLTVLATAATYAVWRGRSMWLVGVALVLWSMAITTYEVSLLMLPAIIILIVVKQPKSLRHALLALGGLGIPTLIDVSIVAHLRTSLSAPPAEEFRVALTTETPITMLHQFVSAVPLSQYFFGIAPVSFPLLTPLGIVLAVTISAGIGFSLIRGSIAMSRTQQHPWALIVSGLWAWVIPSVLAGITMRWQTALPTNQGYIYVVYESLGVALLVGGVFTLLTNRLRDPFSRRIAIGIAVAAAVALGLTVGTNLNYVQQMPPGPSGPDWPVATPAEPTR